MQEVIQVSLTPTPKLAEALVGAQSEFQAVPFDSVNPHFKNPFASMVSIVSSTKAILTKWGLAITHSMSGMTVVTTLMHKSGESISCTIPILLSKQDMQGLGSAITYAKRYGMSAILNLVTDADDDGNQASKPNESPRANPEAAKTINNPKGFAPQTEPTGKRPAIKSAFEEFGQKAIPIKSNAFTAFDIKKEDKDL